jgi:hypothetical protein
MTKLAESGGKVPDSLKGASKNFSRQALTNLTR